jgi:hypothetical protein
MKIWAPMVLTAALVTSIGLAPVANAEPPLRNDHNDHLGGPGPHGGPPALDHRPPGEPPRGEPRLEPREYQARLQRIQDERLSQRQALRRDEHAWENSRAQRELEHRRQLEGVWGPQFLRRPEVRPELAINADREARLERMIDLAQDAHDAASEARARAILAREYARHARAMAALRANWNGE